MCPRRQLNEAPRSMVAEVYRYVNSYYPAYEDGHLLVAGGISDQPARYIALVQLTQAYDRMVQAKYEELREKDNDGE